MTKSFLVHTVYYRKLKNRMSAQQARDRKKQYVEDLEKRVAQLEKEV